MRGQVCRVQRGRRSCPCRGQRWSLASGLIRVQPPWSTGQPLNPASMPRGRKAAAKASAEAVQDPEPEAAEQTADAAQHPSQTVEVSSPVASQTTHSPIQTVYIKNLNEKIKKPGTLVHPVAAPADPPGRAQTVPVCPVWSIRTDHRSGGPEDAQDAGPGLYRVQGGWKRGQRHAVPPRIPIFWKAYGTGH